MPVRKFKPVTPGTRFRVGNQFAEITTDKPEKSLLGPKKESGGRNHSGKQTQRYRGGGHKQRYRIIDFKRDKDNIPATVKTIEYDPNRTAWIALLWYADGEKRYIIAPKGFKGWRYGGVRQRSHRFNRQRYVALGGASRFHRPRYRDDTW